MDLRCKKYDKPYKKYVHKFRTNKYEEAILKELMAKKDMNLTKLILSLAVDECVRMNEQE